MDIRHLAVKTPEGVSYRKDVVVYDKPLTIPMHRSTNRHEDTSGRNIEAGRDTFLSTPLGAVAKKSNSDELRSLCEIYGYTKELPFNEVEMTNLARDMFPDVNPMTGQADITGDMYYTPYIPMVVFTGVIPPQEDGGHSYFNPEGVVTVAEFLDGLNAIKYGCNANRHRKKTLDRISNEMDYFNEGYQDCVRGISSPFFNLYTRGELLEPLTRFELAYITVLCWTQFLDKYNSVFGGRYYLGFNFDWEYPVEELNKFEDGFDYGVSRCTSDDNAKAVVLDLHAYKGNQSMTDYKRGIKAGSNALPLPAFMSMVEVGILGLFNYGGRLDPLKEVSRGELCYFLSMLAKNFKMLYIN